MTWGGDESVTRTVVSSRRAYELEERRSGTRRIIVVGLVAWPAFAVADVVGAIAGGHAHSLPLLLALRAVGTAMAALGFLSIRKGRPSAARLTLADAGLFVMGSILIAIQATKLGGLSSRLILGVMILSFVRSALLPSHWTRALTVAGLTAVAYPLTLGVLAFIDADIAAQWRSPLFRTFAFECLFLFAGVIVGSVGSHMGWSARRQVFEARKLGNYRLKVRIGGGGNGDVWLARQDPLGRDVALKVMKERGSRNDEKIRRFEREARAASRLQHPNTIRIFEFGASDDGVLFMAMELLDGLDLDAMVQMTGPLSAERAVKLARQAAGSLAEAHEKHIVHRDIKPANFFVTRVGEEWDFLKTLDFGVAQVRERGEPLTEDGVMFGTPAYMSPEVCGGNPADARSDVYSLGAVMYFLVTASPLFPNRTFSETVMSHLSREPEPPSVRLGAPIAEDFERVIMRCLKKDPAERYASARELDEALAACASCGKWSDGDAKAFWLSVRPSVQLRVRGAA